MLGRERRLTHDDWWAYLSAPGRELTLDEFRALEAAHAHQLLGEIAAGLGMDPHRTGGYLEQIRNLFDGAFRNAIRRPQARPSAAAGPVPLPFRASGRDGDAAGGE